MNHKEKLINWTPGKLKTSEKTSHILGENICNKPGQRVLTSTIYKEHLQFKIKKKSNPIIMDNIF